MAGLGSSLTRRDARGHQGCSALHSQVVWGPPVAAVPHSLPVWLHPTELSAVAWSFMEPHTHFPLKGEFPDIPVTLDLWPLNLDLDLTETTQPNYLTGLFPLSRTPSSLQRERALYTNMKAFTYCVKDLQALGFGQTAPTP